MAVVTPIFASQTTFLQTSSTTETDATCKTSALANGIQYIVFYRAQWSGTNLTNFGQVRFRHGDSGTASDGDLLGDSTGSVGATVGSFSGGPCSGVTRLTGNGSDVLKFTYNKVSGGGDTTFDEGFIIAIPLSIFPEGVDYFYSGSEDATLQITDAATGSWTVAVDETWDFGSSDDWLVFMSLEGQPEDGSTAGAARARFLVGGTELISGAPDYVREWDGDGSWYSFSVANVVTLSGSTTLSVEGRSRNQAEADFRRGRIFALRTSRFSQFLQDTDTAGDTINSTTPATLLSQAYTPATTEYVVALCSAVIGSSSATGVLQARLYNATDAVDFQVTVGHRTVDAGFDAGSDQYPEILLGVQQLTAAGGAKTFQLDYSRSGSNDVSIGRQADGTTAIDSHLILFGLEVDVDNVSVTPSPVELDLTVPTGTVTLGTTVVTPDPVVLLLTMTEPTIAGIPQVVASGRGNSLFRVLTTDQQNGKLLTLLESDGLIEQALTNDLTKALAATGTTSLTYDEGRNALIDFTGALAAPEDIILPQMQKWYWLRNSTSGGQTVRVRTDVGATTVTLTAAWKLVHCNAVDVVLLKTGV